MNRLPVIKNKGRFSFVIDLFSWAFPLNYDGCPGGYGWTHRLRILCFNFHYRTQDNPAYDDYEDEVMGYSRYDEEDIPYGSVIQLVEMADSKSVCCQFESDRSH